MFFSGRRLRASDKQILVNPFVVAADVVVKDSSKHHVTPTEGFEGAHFSGLWGLQRRHLAVVSAAVGQSDLCRVSV